VLISCHIGKKGHTLLCPVPALFVHLLAVDAEIIVKHSQRAVGIDGNMQSLVNQEVVSWTLAYNPEVVYEREIGLAILQRTLKALLCNTSRLVLGASRLADTTDALWLEMEIATDIAAIDGKRDQGVERTTKVHNFSGTPGRAGDEDSQTDVRLIVDLHRCVGRDDQNRQHGSETHCYSPNTSLHEVFLHRAIVG
jgi:hypothetical protein